MIAGPLLIPDRDRVAAAAAVRLSLVVPTYNEAANIGALLAELTGLLDAMLGEAYEIIVVDDDSPDGTAQLAERFAGTAARVRVLRRAQERGLSTAVIRGWQLARGDVLGVIDGDLQHPPQVLRGLWHQITLGHDLAVASRHVEGGGVSEWSLWRRAVSRAAQAVGLVLLPDSIGRVSDPMSGYLLVRRRALAGVALDPLGYKILVELLARGQIRSIAEVPYVFRERQLGSSKLTGSITLDYLRHLVRLRLASETFRRFLRFGVVGLSGVVVDMTLLYLLSDPQSLGWGLTRSKLIAAEVAIINNFLWNDAWTFGDRSRRHPGLARRLRRFAKFQAVCLAGLAMNTVLLNLQFNLLGMNRYVANAIAIAAVTGWNFWLNLKISWRR
jgi:dolichol-phosphate mannosyltransferase